MPKRLPKLSQLVCLITLSFLVGCSTPAKVPLAAHVQHIVVVWLKEPGNELHRKQLLDASQKLTEIPGIISVEGGSVITSNRSVVDSSFDIALVITMQNKTVLGSYVHHPLHQRLLKEIFIPLTERYRVFDVEQPSAYR